MFLTKEFLKTILSRIHLFNQCIVEFINFFYEGDSLQDCMKECVGDNSVGLLSENELFMLWDRVDGSFEESREIMLGLLLIFRINPHSQLLTMNTKVYKGLGLCFIRYKNHLVEKYGKATPIEMIETYELLTLSIIIYHHMIHTIANYGHLLNVVEQVNK